MKRHLAMMAVSLAVCGCMAVADTDAVPTSADVGEASRVTVRYASNRVREGTEGANFGYDDGRGALVFGVAGVSLPPGHVKGRLEAPPLKSPAALADRRFHVYLESVRQVVRAAFVEDLRGALTRAAREEILVFIHGYNTDFGLAMRRAAQLAADLQFDGVMVAFSWPSAGWPTSYVADQNNADWAAPGLARTLRLLVDESGAVRIHLLAHSMGGRILLDAFDELMRERDSGTLPLFGQVIFAAPDVDAAIFAQTARRLLPVASRFTLYASDSDMAMAAARSVAGGYPRAGDSGSGIVVLPGMDTVDASAVRDDIFGHEYFGESAPVLDDMRLLLTDGTGAAARPRMERRAHGGLIYWRLLPPPEQ